MHPRVVFVASAALLLLGGTRCPGEDGIDRSWADRDRPVRYGTNNVPAEILERDALPAGPEAKKELSVKREEIFEFTSPPRLTRAGDRVDIYFESKAFCDATVAIEDANGKIVRHLASGVLGDNAPEPFEKNAKKQHVVWNGKDDFGVYMDDKNALTVRVSLGLKAKFEKNLHYYPMPDFCDKPVVRAGPEGIFVYNSSNNSVWDWLLQFDHDGNYVKTVYPFAANKLDKIKGLDWTYAWPEDRKIPVKQPTFRGTLLPFTTGIFDFLPNVGDLTIRNGWVTMLGRPLMARLNVDGTTQGQNLAGPSMYLTTIKRSSGKSFPRRAAASPDGKWIYLTRAIADAGPTDPGEGSLMAKLMDHAVYRVPADGSSEPQVFIGEPTKSGTDNAHFDKPTGIAVDPQGRIYIADWENNRIQVYAADGKFVQTIPQRGVADIAIHQKTGEIYVFIWQLLYILDDGSGGWPVRMFRGEGWEYNGRGCPPRVRKLKPLDAGAGLIYESPLLEDVDKDGHPKEAEKDARTIIPAYMMRAELDSWSPQPVIWLFTPTGWGRGAPRLLAWKEENNKLTLYRDFGKEREAAGLQTKFRTAGAYRMNRQLLYFDPKHQVLYVGEPDVKEMKYFTRLLAIEVASGKEKIVKLPFDATDAAIDAKGRIYLLNDDIIGRFDLETWHEVPFDYGKEYGRDGKIVSVVQTIGGHTSSYKHQSLGVSPQGDIIVAGSKGVDRGADRRKDVNVNYGFIPWRPAVYPGRPVDNVCVNVFNMYGELVHEDVLAGIGFVTGGLDMDCQNNIYAAVPAARILDQHPLKYNTGTLARFPPQGGRFLTNGAKAMSPLDKQPDGPAPVRGDTGGSWIEGAQWLFGGTPTGLIFLNCQCRQARFKTDYFGRSFVPEAWRYSVAVVDTAGNVVMRIGQYGNADSAGPKSLVPLGGDEIGLFDAQFLTVDTDKRVFIADPANDRIVSGLLGYHAEQRLPLREIRDEAKK
jgi:DNA-binding beta-propeller fold protein YncE